MKRVHHLGAVVRDIDRTLDFYCNMLGASVAWSGEQEVQEGEQTDIVFGLPNCRVKVAGINLHGTIIEFFQFLSPDSSQFDKLTDNYASLGWKHIAIEVVDIMEEVTRLNDNGVQLLFPVQTLPNGDKMVYFSDPDGLMIEFIQPRR